MTPQCRLFGQVFCNPCSLPCRDLEFFVFHCWEGYVCLFFYHISLFLPSIFGLTCWKGYFGRIQTWIIQYKQYIIQEYSEIPNFKLNSFVQHRNQLKITVALNNRETSSFKPRGHLSNLGLPIVSPLATFTGCQTWYFLLAPIYQC